VLRLLPKLQPATRNGRVKPPGICSGPAQVGAPAPVFRYDGAVKDAQPSRGAPMQARLLEHADALCNLARYLSSQAEAAEDLVQETFLRALSAAPKLDRDRDLKPWLFRILRNVFLDLYRREKKHAVLESLDEDTAAADPRLRGDAELDILRAVVARDMESAVKSLAEEGRTVLLLDLEGFTETEIADIMECPVGTVKSRLMRARANLRKQLCRYAK
jgi:RNA polymerase sigma-70 factor (ECF subfamily)